MAESEPIHSLLVCSICLERFTHPKMLPCQHTFCLNCLRGITKGAKTLNCPHCRERHHVPRNGVPGFRDNLVIKDLLLIVGDSAECRDCKKIQILKECSHCEQQVCKICLADHTRLRKEIVDEMTDIMFQYFNKEILEQSPEDKTDWQTALDETLKEEAKVKVAFKEAATALRERGKQLLRPIQNTARFQKALIEKNRDTIIEEFQQELQSCETVESLQLMKGSFSDVAEALSSFQTMGIGPEFSCNMSNIAGFGQIMCGESTWSNITSNEVNVPLDGTRGETMTDKTPHAPSIDYESKNMSWKRLITRQPGKGKGKEFNPTFALYSHHHDSLFCISDSDLLLYDTDVDVGKRLFPKVKVQHIAITESGQLLFTDGQNVMRADLNRLDNAVLTYSRIELFCRIGRVSQFCCYGEEFVVLDSEKQCLIAFTEDGKLFRQFTIEKIYINENSRMCVDHHGRIYVTSAHVEREECGDVYCQPCGKSESVGITMESVIIVLSWKGEFIEEIWIDDWSEEFDYKIHGSCNHLRNKFFNMRDENSVPSDEVIIRQNSIRGICVDADGYISITTPFGDQIEVYNPERELHCTIGDPDGRHSEFMDPAGVALMPDGGMIVCDTGNNRIQIISTQRLDTDSLLQNDRRTGVRRRALEQHDTDSDTDLNQTSDTDDNKEVNRKRALDDETPDIRIAFECVALIFGIAVLYIDISSLLIGCLLYKIYSYGKRYNVW